MHKNCDACWFRGYYNLLLRILDNIKAKRAQFPSAHAILQTNTSLNYNILFALQNNVVFYYYVLFISIHWSLGEMSSVGSIATSTSIDSDKANQPLTKRHNEKMISSFRNA